jgi:large subunit ribosomal protein L23
MRTIWDIIKSPVSTEKAFIAKDEQPEGQAQVLTLRVENNATKDEIRQAVEQIFNVQVSHVRTVNYQGKMKRRGRFEGRRPSWKKAFVTLKKGQEPLEYGEAI